jgi:type 1 fimbria pilin
MTFIKIRYLAAFLLCLNSPLVLAQADLNFSGTLVQEPCTLAPEDTNITVDFGTIINKNLYTDKRSIPHLFTLHLVDCDTSLGNQVRVMFTGTEDSAQSGLLALDGTSTASGVALGIEDLHGTLLPVNQLSSSFPLQEGSSEIHLAAFVQASDTAIANKAIVSGDFSASATFEFSYD